MQDLTEAQKQAEQEGKQLSAAQKRIEQQGMQPTEAQHQLAEAQKRMEQVLHKLIAEHQITRERLGIAIPHGRLWPGKPGSLYA